MKGGKKPPHPPHRELGVSILFIFSRAVQGQCLSRHCTCEFKVMGTACDGAQLPGSRASAFQHPPPPRLPRPCWSESVTRQSRGRFQTYFALANSTCSSASKFMTFPYIPGLQPSWWPCSSHSVFQVHWVGVTFAQTAPLLFP